MSVELLVPRNPIVSTSTPTGPNSAESIVILWLARIWWAAAEL